MLKDQVNNSENRIDDFLKRHTSCKEQQALLQKISAKKIENLHSMAYVYYQNQRYREADSLFRLLVTIRPKNFQYWKGLAACLQMKKNYEGALHCYQCAQTLLDQIDPYLCVHIADCHFAMKQLQEGFKILEAAKKRAKKINDEKIIRHVAFMYERWKN